MESAFRRLALGSALLFFALALIWMLAPDLLLLDWGVEFTASAGFVGRRAAAVYAGVGVMFLSARNAEPSTARTALINGGAVTGLALAALGIVEFKAGHASARILVAVGIEVALARAFLYVGRRRGAGVFNEI